MHFNTGINFYGGGIQFGYIVEIFFMISGFLTIRSFKDRNFLSFYIKKWVRIFPYAFIATLFAAIIFLLYRAIFNVDLFGKSFSPGCYITSLLCMHQGWVYEYSLGVNNPTWYLCVLLWIYILFYALESINRWAQEKYIFSFRIIYCLFLIILGALGWRFNFSFPFLYKTDCRGYAAFFLGVLLYELTKKARKIRLFLCGLILFIVGAMLILIMHRLSWAVCVFLIFPGTLLMTINSKQFPNIIVEKIGDCTFEIYLWHIPIFLLIECICNFFAIAKVHTAYSMILITIFILCIGMLANHINYLIGKRLLKGVHLILASRMMIP